MARIVYSDSLRPGVTPNSPTTIDLDGKTYALSQIDGHHIYNALDAALTHEISNVMQTEIGEEYLPNYRFEFGMQGPALTLMRRGILIDQEKRMKVHALLSSQIEKLNKIFELITTEICGKAINYKSPDQLKFLFYTSMKIPEITVFDYATKKKKVSTNREAMEKLENYFYAGPLARLILQVRDLEKKRQVVRAGIAADGRMRCSYGVAATETGRWNSSKNVYGGGTNNQNLTDEMREMFVADEGMKLAYLDLEQAESKAVALLSGDPGYISACASGDLHTFVCKMVWTNLPWTGDPKKDKLIAEQKFYRHFTYRDMAKRGGHLTNYVGKPATMAHHLKIAVKLAEEFQARYFSAFPGIPQWHQRVGRTLATDFAMVTPLGRKRLFFDRVYDDSTIRAAVAHVPQSSIGEILNIGLYRIWSKMDRAMARRNSGSVFSGSVEVLAQVHDAILLQYPEDRELEVLPEALRLMRVQVECPFGLLDIPTEAAVGWNWRKRTVEKDGTITNPWGLKKFNGTLDERSRPERTAIPSLLDRLVY